MSSTIDLHVQCRFWHIFLSTVGCNKATFLHILIGIFHVVSLAILVCPVYNFTVYDLQKKIRTFIFGHFFPLRQNFETTSVKMIICLRSPVTICSVETRYFSADKFKSIHPRSHFTLLRLAENSFCFN